MIDSWRQKLSKFQTEKQRLLILSRETVKYQIKMEDHLINLEEASVLVLETSKDIQRKVHERISSVVSSCLRTVFDDPYEFEIVFETKAGRTEAKIQFVRCEMCVDPLSGSGGGVVDVAAFALRVAALSLRRPALRKVLIFDEPFRFVSREYRPRVRSLIEKLSEEFEIQFIMVTHLSELRCGKVVELSKGLENAGAIPEEE